MFLKKRCITLYLISVCLWSYSQETVTQNTKPTNIKSSSINLDLDASSKAAFYSAVFPGLGQAYNKKYWRIPLVYASFGFGIYAYVNNNRSYERLRTAYKSRLNGKLDEFNGEDGNPFISTDGLASAQKSFRNYRDLSILAMVGIYILQILEASVTAHLMQFDVSDQLSFRPAFFQNKLEGAYVSGVQIQFNF